VTTAQNSHCFLRRSTVANFRHISAPLSVLSSTTAIDYYAAVPIGWRIMQWRPLSVCLSVCLSVPFLNLIRERKGVASWKLAGRKSMTHGAMTRVTRPVTSFRVESQGHIVAAPLQAAELVTTLSYKFKRTCSYIRRLSWQVYNFCQSIMSETRHILYYSDTE